MFELFIKLLYQYLYDIYVRYAVYNCSLWKCLTRHFNGENTGHIFTLSVNKILDFNELSFIA